MSEDSDPLPDLSSARAARVNRAIFLLPNFLTLCAVIFGLTALRLSGEGKPELAMAAIFAAVVLDTADGYAARLLGAESPIGAELDSLADFVNFGVAPGMLLYQRDLHLLGWTGWIISGIYVLATGIRLARFNVESKSAEETKQSKWFSGLPSTGAAVAVLIADGAANIIFRPENAALLTAGAAIAASALMLSTLRVPAPFKGQGARSRDR
ncbi:MAG: CDP-alcohol phosphatidyltransferase family protein [Rhodomicrobium sp.]